jgi:hypothetical protein
MAPLSELEVLATHRRLSQEDCLSPGVQGQPYTHSETLSQELSKQKSFSFLLHGESRIAKLIEYDGRYQGPRREEGGSCLMGTISAFQNKYVLKIHCTTV